MKIGQTRSFANIEADGAGKLRTIIQVSHLLLGW
jgi:hypothetical protein